MSTPMSLGTPLSLPEWPFTAFVGSVPLWSMHTTGQKFEMLGSDAAPAVAVTIAEKMGPPLACFVSKANKVVAVNSTDILCANPENGSLEQGFPMGLSDFFGRTAWPEGRTIDAALPLQGSDEVWLFTGAIGIKADLAARKLANDGFKTIDQVIKGVPSQSIFATGIGVPLQNLETAKTVLIQDDQTLSLDDAGLVADRKTVPILTAFPNWPTGDPLRHGIDKGSAVILPDPEPKPVPSLIPKEVLENAAKAQIDLLTAISIGGSSVIDRSASFFPPLFKQYGTHKPSLPPYGDSNLLGKWTRFETDAGLVTPEHVVWIYLLDLTPNKD